MSESFVNIGLAVERYDRYSGLWVMEQEIEEAHSWTKQAAQIWMSGFLFTPTLVASVLDTGNVSRTLETPSNDNGQNWMRSTAAAGDATVGIVVGTGSSAVDRDDIAVSGANEATKIAHGSGAGQLDYKAVAYPDSNVALAITGGYRSRIQRQFENLSGGAITINEVALYVSNDLDGAGTAIFCVLRDLLTVSIPNTELKRVQYRLDFLI